MSIVVIEGANCKDKQHLFEEFKKTCNFPDYFGDNWDSFEEIMQDFVNDHNGVVEIFFKHYKKILKKYSEDKNIFENIIKDLPKQKCRIYRLKKISL
jgi:RNAse (barnase) inhibitor barstar